MKQRYLLYFLIFLNISIPSLASPQKIAKAIKEIEKQDTPTHNPLIKFDFEAYTSRAYLYYYRAYTHYKIGKNSKVSSQKIHYERALQDLKLAQSSPLQEEEKITKLFDLLHEEQAYLGLRSKDYKLTIKAIESLPEKKQEELHYVLLYGAALFYSKRISEFKHLARMYLSTFENENFIRLHLDKVPNWRKNLGEIQSHRSKVTKSYPSPYSRPLNLSRSHVLKNPKRYLTRLEKDHYFTDADKIFKYLSKLYFALSSNQKATGTEKSFVNHFERRMDNFAPKYIDKLIKKFWSRQNLEKAEKLSKVFLKKYKAYPDYHEILYDLGRIQEDGKKYSDAFKSYQKYIKFSDKKNYFEYAFFRSAWVLYLDGKHKKAHEHFTQYLKYFPEGAYASTSDYFSIKTSQYQSKKDPEKRVLENFIEKYSLNFYSLLIVDEYSLNKDVILSKLSPREDLKSLKKRFENYPIDLQDSIKLNAHKELLKFGLKEEAIDVLKSVTFNPRNDLLSLFLASEFYNLKSTHGEFYHLIRIYSHFDHFQAYIPWRSLFPSFRYEKIKTLLAEKNLNLSPYLVMSLIRQESAFDPKATSSANAMGLMQMIPSTAKKSAKKIGLKNYSLHNENDNLTLGIETLRGLLNYYDNRLHYTLAGYNAGEHVTDKWIHFRGGLNPIEFIESIPYQETRIYIKNILRNFAIYKMLYEEKGKNSLISYELR